MQTRQLRQILTLSLLMLVFILAISSSEPAAAAGPWYVAPGGADGNDCLSPGTPCETIHGALGKASSGDTIYVATGTYTRSGTPVLLVSKDILLSGGWDLSFTSQDGYSTIDGEDTHRGITINSGLTVELERFEITNSSTGSTGGGIQVISSNLTVRDSAIHNNYAYAGGGGITASSSTLTIVRSSISQNYSPQWGGGIFSSCTDLYIDNSTISENITDSGGGGISHDCLTTLSVNSSSIVGNLASVQSGGGIRTAGGASIKNSILALNTSGTEGHDCSGEITSLGYNVISDSTNCTITATSGDQFDSDPLVGPIVAQPGYNALSASSPAIDAGNPAGCTDHDGDPITQDQRGEPRSGVCDIGAFEYSTPTAAASIHMVSGSPQRAEPLAQFSEALVAALLDASGNPVVGDTVDFTAPASGPSGTFADSGTNVTSIPTDQYGLAETSLFTANEQAGAYVIDAAVSGFTGTAQFDLINAAWFVSTGGSNGSDCSTPLTPCASINAVFAKPGFVPGETINVEAGTYTGGGGFVADIDDDAVLKGGWDPTFTTQNSISTLDGGGTVLTVYIGVGIEAAMDRFVIQNGFNGNGGGIINWGNLTITNSTVTQNLKGGGIWNTDIGVLNMDNCIVSDNVSDAFSSNSGGGIKNNGEATITQTTISGNSANNQGGGIVNTSTVSLVQSTISDNEAASGGGIQNNGTLFLEDSTVSGNQATSRGGGILSESCGGCIYTYLNNATVSDNTADEGGGVYDNGSGDVIASNSIIASNTATSTGPDCAGTIDSLGYNLIGNTADCTFNDSDGDLLDRAAWLESLGLYGGVTETHRLGSLSPAINGGNPSGCEDHESDPLDYDQRGAPRLARCDMGSYEAQSYKDVSDQEAIPGDTLHYEIGLRNWSGPTRIYTVTDTLPADLTYVNGSLSATQGTPNYSAGVIHWSETVDHGQDVTISFDAGVGSILGPLVNSAVINNGSTDVTRSASTMIDAPICTVTKYASNPVLHLGTPGSWDDDGIWHPTVILDGSTYKMWYAGNDDTYVNHIGLATSLDGYGWAKEESNPILSPTEIWEAAGVSRPSVILDGSTYKMWFTGVDSSGVIQIGYATSPEGIVWTKHPGNPVLAVGAASSWEDEDVTGPTVLKDDGTYHMWYAGNNGSEFRIGHATSSDGITWVKDPANPVLDVGDVGDWDWLGIYSPDVVKIGDSYKLWYSGETLPQAWQTGHAESTDGTNWTRKDMLIPEGPPGTFDTNSADHPAVLIDGSSYRVWYAGIDDSHTYTIGHAEAQLCTGAAHTLYLPLVMKDYSPAPPCPPDYAEDFSDPSSGWYIFEDPDVKYDYTGSEYQIWLKNPAGNDGRWVTPGAKATDFTVAVSARRTSGTEGPYGILFGISDDWSELYEVSIDQNFYDIWKYDSGWFWLAGGPSPDIATGTGWNRIKVTREGSTISVYINDQFQTTVYDGSFTGFRRIGLSAYSPSGSGLEFRFDDFALYPASCGPIAADTQGLEWGEAEAHEAIVPPKPEEME
ncbi:MAG: choice-of-anchor Q domain-containing protein [Anaerolineales bacterium]